MSGHGILLPMLAATLPDLSRLDREGLQALLLAEHQERMATHQQLLRCRDGESVTELLTRLDLAIAKALTEGIRTDEVNPIKQEYIPNK